MILLNNLVEQYLIFAQGQANRRIPMYMKNWVEKLNGFLTLNDREVLINAGRISHQIAKENAESEYKMFKALRQTSLDDDSFEREIKKLKNKNRK